MNILHITDFHIRPTKEEDYPLTKSNYTSYISELKKTISEDIDILIVTGDIFSKGDITSNLEHAKSIIKFISEEMGIPLKNIFMCPGEHDFVKDYDKKLISDKDGKFSAFIKNNCHIDYEYEHDDNIDYPLDYLNELPNDGVLILMLDSIFRTNDVDKRNNRCSQIIESIKVKLEANNKFTSLIVGSHYPATIDLITDQMVQKSLHGVWGHPYWFSTVHIILDGLSKLSDHLNIVCLSGDMHVPKSISKNMYNKERSTIDFFSTNAFGMLYENPDEYSSHQQNGVRVVKLNGNNVSSSLYLHSSTVHQNNTHDSFKWRKNSSDISLERKQLEPINSVDRIKIHDLNSIDPASQTANDENLESMILQAIESKPGIYKLGRYAIHEHVTALGWISITPLLADESIMSLFVNNLSKIIKQHLSNDVTNSGRKCNPAECVLIGLNFWGASIACQVSLLTGIKNQCISVEGDSANNMVGEGLSERVYSDIENAKCIIIITDVISSGTTIAKTYEKISQRLSTEKQSWLVFSLICDENQPRNVEKLNFADFYSACKGLKMPLFSTDSLPSEKLLPCNMKF